MLEEKRREFLHEQNIKHFEERLSTEADPARRTLLLELLAEEKAGKLAPPTEPKP